MPGLREEIISIICEEWPNSDDELNEVAIHDRLEVAGVGASQEGVQEVLLQLSDQNDIRLVGEPGAPDAPDAPDGLAVDYVDPELCP